MCCSLPAAHGSPVEVTVWGGLEPQVTGATRFFCHFHGATVSLAGVSSAAGTETSRQVSGT